MAQVAVWHLCDLQIIGRN